MEALMKCFRFITMILLIVALAGTAAAKSNLGFYSFGAKVGFVKPEDIDGTFGLGLQANFGTLSPQLALEGFFEYWGKSYDVLGADASFTDLVFGGMLKYYFDINSNIKPYTEGALALHFGRAKVENAGFSASDTEMDIGIHIGGGVEMPLSDQMIGFGEVKYAVSDLSYIGLFAGINYKLGK